MRKNNITTAVLTFALTVGSTAAIYASVPQFSTPKQFPTGIYIQPSETSAYVPTPRPKGVEFYTEFANVPDYASYARLQSSDIMSFGTKYGDFYYIDDISRVFSYTSKVYDYFDTGSPKLGEYKNYLERIGFRQSEELAVLIHPDSLIENDLDFSMYAENPRYIELMREDILYDPDFILDSNGVYYIETEYGFTVVAFGNSANYNGGFSAERCNEIRLYNLYYEHDIMGNIMKYAENFQNGLDARTFYLYVPERDAYITLTSDAVSSYVSRNDPADYTDGTSGIDDYMQRLSSYLGF